MQPSILKLLPLAGGCFLLRRASFLRTLFFLHQMYKSMQLPSNICGPQVSYFNFNLGYSQLLETNDWKAFYFLSVSHLYEVRQCYSCIIANTVMGDVIFPFYMSSKMRLWMKSSIIIFLLKLIIIIYEALISHPKLDVACFCVCSESWEDVRGSLEGLPAPVLEGLKASLEPDGTQASAFSR